MAEIRPFQALRYPFSLGAGYADLIAPPYDAIGPEKEKELLARHPHNAVRITLSDPSKRTSSESDDRYQNAGATLLKWRTTGVLHADVEPSIYLIEDRFQWEGTTRTRRGLLLTVRLEELGKGNILPHERTLEVPIQDRQQLMLATKAHESPVYMTFADRSGAAHKLIEEILRNVPALEFQNRDEPIFHRIWRVTDKKWIEDLQKLLKPEPFLIADGHHRYQTALHHSLNEGKPFWEARYVMALVAPSPDPGVVLSAFHRMIETTESTDALIQKISASFEITAADGKFESFERSRSPIAILFRGKTVHVTPRPDAMKALQAELRNVPSCLLNELVFKTTFALDLSSPEHQKRIQYEKDPKSVADFVSKKSAVGFWLKALSGDQVMVIAKAGLTLPQKSTFFYPKVMSGFAFHPF